MFHSGEVDGTQAHQRLQKPKVLEKSGNVMSRNMNPELSCA